MLLLTPSPVILVLAQWTYTQRPWWQRWKLCMGWTIWCFCTETDLIIVTAECQSVHDRGQWQILHGIICRVPAKHPDRLIVLDSFHHGKSNDLEYVSTEVQNFLITYSISASPTMCKLTESCSLCHSISQNISTYKRACFMIKNWNNWLTNKNSLVQQHVSLTRSSYLRKLWDRLLYS